MVINYSTHSLCCTLYSSASQAIGISASTAVHLYKATLMNNSKQIAFGGSCLTLLTTFILLALVILLKIIRIAKTYLKM
jgi:hypothetical protein